MKWFAALLMTCILSTGCKNENSNQSTQSDQEQYGEAILANNAQKSLDSIQIHPVSHATTVIKWGNTVIYLDPTGGEDAFTGQDEPDFILITDIHGDHLNKETLRGLNLGNTRIIVPQAVKEKLSQSFHNQTVVLNNGESQEFMGFDIEAIPMYNLPETADSRHPKGRGNGYVLEKDGKRLYIAGDTEDIPEMRNLKNIDIALVPMNLPYTMDVEKAADAVLAFKPAKVYPYHYRGQDGLADVDRFKQLVNQGDENIEVILLDWYPQRD